MPTSVPAYSLLRCPRLNPFKIWGATLSTPSRLVFHR